MSAESEAFVDRFSPYRGNTLMIHQRFGILANEAYDYRIFMRDEKICDLCRCSPKTLQRARNQMIKDGFLQRVKTAYGHQSAEYVFLFPGLEGHIDRLKPKSRRSKSPSSRSSASVTPIYRTEVKERESAQIVDLEAVKARRQKIMPSIGRT